MNLVKGKQKAWVGAILTCGLWVLGRYIDLPEGMGVTDLQFTDALGGLIAGAAVGGGVYAKADGRY